MYFCYFPLARWIIHLYDGLCYRYVTWTTYLIQFLPKPGLVEPLALPGAPFSHYYAQEPTDEGIIMETEVPVKQVSCTRISAEKLLFYLITLL